MHLIIEKQFVNMSAKYIAPPELPKKKCANCEKLSPKCTSNSKFIHH